MAISAAKKQIRLTQRLVVLARQRHFPLPQSSSASRVTASLGQHAPERGFADHKRITPEVVTVQFDEVEGVEEDALVSAVVPDERSNEGIPLSSQATASPSMMQERERRRASVSTISGKR